MLSADSALADIVDYICINVWPVHCLPCLCLHLVYPLVGSVQVSKSTVEWFQGNTNAGSPEEEAGFYGQLIQGSPEVSGEPWDLLLAIWPSPYGKAVHYTVYQVTFDGTLNDIQLGIG